MDAFAITAYRQPLERIDMPEPVVGSRDVLVAVSAVGLNQLDEKIREGEFARILPHRFPLVLGNDVAGTVVAVGEAVGGFAVGDAVYGRPDPMRMGTLAERIAVDERELAHVPASITMAEAGSLPLVALTAWQALVERGRLGAGQRVLIHAGAGGVGTIAIQLAKHLGATVVTTASARDTELLRSLGADVVIDYRTEDFAELPGDYDLVLDSLGGENLERSLRVLRPGGTAIGIAGPPDPAFAREHGLPRLLRVAIAALSLRVRRRARRLGVRYEFLFMHASGEQLARISELVDAGAIRPVVGRVLPFDATPDALASLTRGGTTGKIVVTLDEARQHRTGRSVA
ncbi:NADP-dependent oxidoreductase [Agrococcus jenensis]|uniref:NADPH:quinone reductase-like Zn-dependent oxidoreductase n=1 Tax=Agrococcus jenensis TaxID=46353 RepID=A0A3N2ANX6_9MICO|nr:NADP-dependent oxidoreductase [Agrococcus jenensis]ROR64771.1 NADPH:quinone reductase-like Zn-dependent oxidoreductase [Agrococcus jenensis]